MTGTTKTAGTRAGSRRRAPDRRPVAVRVGYQPPGPDLYGRRGRPGYHAVTDTMLRLSGIGDTGVTRYPGEALCGYPGQWSNVPDGLFPPLLTCPACQAITSDLGARLDGDQ